MMYLIFSAAAADPHVVTGWKLLVPPADINT